MKKTADTRFPVHELIAERWSPIAFADRAVDAGTLGSLLEAARWAASSYNEQPWAFLVATKDDAEAHADLAACLVPANRAWAEAAPVLMLSVASTTFARNGKPNRHAYHDVGLAVGNLSVQAQASGLVLHQMAGFDAEEARRRLAIPDGWEPVAAIALGYPGAAADLPDELAARQNAPRARKPLAEMAFRGRFGEPAPAVG